MSVQLMPGAQRQQVLSVVVDCGQLHAVIKL